MLMIVGGREVVAALAEATDWRLLGWIEGQCHHAEWHGFRMWDLVFPLFLFLAGVSTAFSIAGRRAAGAGDGSLARHALRRGLALVALGIVYNGLFAFDFTSLRYASVLGRIGIAWMLATLLSLRFGVRGRIECVAVLLVGYWAALTLVPVPGVGAPSLEPGRTLTDWLDRALLPGRLHRVVRDPEGILATLPATATALLGILAGEGLRQGARPGRERALGLALAGAAALAAGWIWSLVFPLNKNLWTSSFVLWTAGWSALLLAAFYWVVDVRGWRAWSFPLVVVGANAIAAYLLPAFVDFEAVARLLFGAATPGRMHPALMAAAAVALEWVLLYALYRRRIFLRVGALPVGARRP